MKAKIYIPLITLCLGFIPMLIMSILMDGFWITSPYDAPLILIPAVFIGDLIFLPQLNYRIYMALKQVISFLKPGVILLTLICCLLLSLALNSYTHYLWSHGTSTGFMEPQYGQLSLAGWWHYGFSVLQMALIFVFAVFWVMTVKHQDRDMFTAFEKALYVFILFILVNISGVFVNKDWVVHGQFTPNLSFSSLFNAFSPLILSILLLAITRKMHRSVNRVLGSA